MTDAVHEPDQVFSVLTRTCQGRVAVFATHDVREASRVYAHGTARALQGADLRKRAADQGRHSEPVHLVEATLVKNAGIHTPAFYRVTSGIVQCPHDIEVSPSGL